MLHFQHLSVFSTEAGKKKKTFFFFSPALPLLFHFAPRYTFAGRAAIEHAHRGIFSDFRGAAPAVAEDLSDLRGCSSVPVPPTATQSEGGARAVYVTWECPAAGVPFGCDSIVVDGATGKIVSHVMVVLAQKDAPSRGDTEAGPPSPLVCRLLLCRSGGDDSSGGGMEPYLEVLESRQQ